MIRPRCAVAAAACAVAVVATACSSSHHALASSSGTASTGGSSAVAATAGTTGGAASAPAGASGHGSSGATTSHAGTAGTGAPAAGGAAGASVALAFGPAGHYRYAVAGSSTMGPVPKSASLTVSAPSGGAQTFSLTDASGGSTTAETLAFRGDGVYLVSLSIAASSPGYPPYSETLAPTSGPVRIIGTSEVPSSTTFTVASADARATVTVHVLGSATATVAGRALPALHVTFSSSDLAGTVHDGLLSAKYTGSFSVDALLAPTDLVPYRQQTSFELTVAAPHVTVASTSTATLQSTTPS